MKYLLFDQNAISIIVSRTVLQSIEYIEGKTFIDKIRRENESGIFENMYIEYNNDGVIFVGEKNESINNHVFCIDLIQCNILSEKDDADLLSILQKVFRTVLRIWNGQPFTSSERVAGSKSIVFPFVMPDHRAVVIERSVSEKRLQKRNINHPLLAYKYSKDESSREEVPDTSILVKAAEKYLTTKSVALRLFPKEEAYTKDKNSSPIGHVTGDTLVNRENFIYYGYEQQYANLTESQRYVVDYEDIDNPLRIDGAAGTGKTVSMLMRAYRLLTEKKVTNEAISIIFFSHSVSTRRNIEQIFRNYKEAEQFIEGNLKQKIRFTTLLDYCKEFAKIPNTEMIDTDAGDIKTFQLMLIQEVVQTLAAKGTINTYKPLLSSEIKEVFGDLSEGNMQNICALLQHEFSVQIKGRTNCTIEEYKELPSIENGLNCKNDDDKEFIYRFFSEYQSSLKESNSYDVDDVTLQALALLNAPIWRRRRNEEGFDYIFVDEMHLFNINEQSVFHYLTRDYTKKVIPICFALDYCQAIGDRGNTTNDYIENAFGKLEKKKYHTVFRNSPKIADFCASIAASGVLMFQNSFENPYDTSQNNFTAEEEKKSQSPPQLHMYKNDDEMIDSISEHLDSLMKELQCKQNEIAVISFDNKFLNEKIGTRIGKKISLLNKGNANSDEFILASPHDINGLEFKAVILLGVDEGRVPQTIGTNDISQNFLKYSAYNLLYLTSSRAKYRLIILGSCLNGSSSCLEHSIKGGYLEVV